MKGPLLVTLLWALGACGAEPREAAAPSPGKGAPPPGEAAWSNARGFYAVWRPLAGEVPLNREFTAEVWLFADETCREPLADEDVAIDCRMPAHGHGMLSEVHLETAGGGRYLAEGMLCHMVGHWELYLDRTVGAVTERAQFDVELE